MGRRPTRAALLMSDMTLALCLNLTAEEDGLGGGVTGPQCSSSPCDLIDEGSFLCSLLSSVYWSDLQSMHVCIGLAARP